RGRRHRARRDRGGAEAGARVRSPPHAAARLLRPSRDRRPRGAAGRARRHAACVALQGCRCARGRPRPRASRPLHRASHVARRRRPRGVRAPVMCEDRGAMKKSALVALVVSTFSLLWTAGPAAEQTAELRIGIIGTDSSHVTAFTKLLNDKGDPDHLPGARVVAAFNGASPDVEGSRNRIDRFSAALKDKWSVEFVDPIEALCAKVDAVLLESVDGRTHLNQVRPVFTAKKRVFIDKPMTASYGDAREIVRLSRESGVRFFSAASLRFAGDLPVPRKSDKHGGIGGAFTFGPEHFEPHHPDLFWYGIHAVEMLYALLGPGCEKVSRVKTDSGDTVVGTWKDGRIGTMRGLIQG